MILFDLLLWLGVFGYSLLLFVCAVGSLVSPDDRPAGPPRDSRERVGDYGRRASDCLPVIVFPHRRQELREADLAAADDYAELLAVPSKHRTPEAKARPNAKTK